MGIIKDSAVKNTTANYSSGVGEKKQRTEKSASADIQYVASLEI